MKTKKSALGRGLSAILESPDTDITSSDISGNYVAGAIANIPIEKIETNPFQPRNQFEEKALLELALSIKEQGIIQPVTVRKLGYDKYQLISGERRYRAAKIAGHDKVPAFIRVANDQQMLEMALIENIHREDLNSLDVAISYQRLLDECDLTKEMLSKRVGKDRSTIVNYIRLLRLPAPVQVALRDNLISMGHARALINVENEDEQLYILNEAVKQQLSVREVEKMVKEATGRPKNKPKNQKPELPDAFREVRDLLISRFETKVDIKWNNKDSGSIVIPFKSDDDLQRIIDVLDK